MLQRHLVPHPDTSQLIANRAISGQGARIQHRQWDCPLVHRTQEARHQLAPDATTARLERDRDGSDAVRGDEAPTEALLNR